MTNTLCHMIHHWQIHLANTVAMLVNHVFFHVNFSTKACHGFGRPQTWALNIYICVGTSLIGWLDGSLTVPHVFSVPDTPSTQYGNARQPCVFLCWLLNQGMT